MKFSRNSPGQLRWIWGRKQAPQRSTVNLSLYGLQPRMYGGIPRGSASQAVINCSGDHCGSKVRVLGRLSRRCPQSGLVMFQASTLMQPVQLDSVREAANLYQWYRVRSTVYSLLFVLSVDVALRISADLPRILRSIPPASKLRSKNPGLHRV